MPRVAKIGILLLAGILVVLLLMPLALRHEPSVLYVHIDGLAWSNVTVQSENLPEPQRFNYSSEVRVSPVSHGVYRIGVQLADGRSIWSEFLHTDTRAHRRVDLFLAPSANPGCIRFRQTANQEHLLFEGEVLPSRATEQTPFRLNWI